MDQCNPVKKLIPVFVFDQKAMFILSVRTVRCHVFIYIVASAEAKKLAGLANDTCYAI